MAEAAEWIDKNFTKIIIIGAGIGGISAADALTKNGITDFKILEAGSKIGGRIEAIEAGRSMSYFFPLQLSLCIFLLTQSSCSLF